MKSAMVSGSDLLKLEWFDPSLLAPFQVVKSKYYLQWVLSWLNTEVQERREERKERWAVSLKPAYAQEQKKIVRGTSGPCIND